MNRFDVTNRAAKRHLMVWQWCGHLLDLEERSIAEIQEITGWNATLIKVRAFRARRKMKKHLAQMEKAERNERKS